MKAPYKAMYQFEPSVAEAVTRDKPKRGVPPAESVFKGDYVRLEGESGKEYMMICSSRCFDYTQDPPMLLVTLSPSDFAGSTIVSEFSS